jgi:hypothetical protein
VEQLAPDHSMLSACLSKQASRALLRRRFARSTKENDSSSVYDSSATEMFRHNVSISLLVSRRSGQESMCVGSLML